MFSSFDGKEKQLCLKFFSDYSVKKWKKCYKHVYKIEDNNCMKDAVIKKIVDSLIISLNYQSSESNSTSSEDNRTDDSENKCNGTEC